MVSIPACHAGDRGSIPRRGGCYFFTSYFTCSFIQEITSVSKKLEKVKAQPLWMCQAPGGVEPSTFCLLDRRSNQLSYGAAREPVLIHGTIPVSVFLSILDRLLSITSQRERRECTKSFCSTSDGTRTRNPRLAHKYFI